MGYKKMLCNLIKRGMIYGYFLFIGYQLLTNLSASNQFTESINRFEARHEVHFSKIYAKVPQLVQYKAFKYPAALVGFSALSVLCGGFGIFALATHALITVVTNDKLVTLVKSINPKMDFVKFGQNLELEYILLLALYLGVLCQIIYSIFGGCASRCQVKEEVVVEDNKAKSNTKKKGNKQ